MSKRFTPTSEQQDIIDVFARELGTSASARRHLIINAGAGTGKTTSLRLMSDPHQRKSGLYIAFNKSVADSASEVFGRHIECRTSHSLAYRHIMRSAEYAPLLEKSKTGPQRDDRQGIARDFNMNSRFITVKERRTSGIQERTVGGFQLVSIALAVIERFCQTAAREPSSAHITQPRNFVPADFEDYRAKVWAQIESLVHALWLDVLDPKGKYLTFRHDHYLKLFALSQPVLNYDFILLDEAQDTAPVTEEIVTRQASHALLVMVGDPSQAIYGFTGARDSMTRFEKSGIAYESLTLSESWRFGEEIADAANALLEQTERDMRIVGRGGEGEVLHHLSGAVNDVPGTYVCRTNFDVIEAALEVVGKGLTVDTSSVDLSDVENFLQGARELKAGSRTQKGGLGPYSRWAEFELDYEDGVPMTEGQRVGMMLLDKYSTEDACESKIAIIRDASTTANRADVKVVTIHKAKGGEWYDVSIRYDSAFRRVKDKDNPNQDGWWELADPHLAYVAATRAIEVLDPGLLWPVIEYRIVCDPGVLSGVAKGMLSTMSTSDKDELRKALKVNDWTRVSAKHKATVTQRLTACGVRGADTATASFCRLMANIVAVERKASVSVPAQPADDDLPGSVPTSPSATAVPV